METTVKIEGKEHGVLYKGITARIYRETFNRDLLIDIQQAQMNFDEGIKKAVDEDRGDENAYFILLKGVGSEFFERLLWACIKAYDVKNNLVTEPFNVMVDNVDDYESFVLIGVILFEKIVYSNKATVEDETEKKDEENKKKKINKLF